MFLASFSSLLRDSVMTGSNSKYKIHSLDYTDSESTSVICEVLGQHKFIKFDLQEIIKDKLRFFDSSDVLKLSQAFTENKTVPKNDRKHYNSITIAFTVLLLLSNIAETKICNFFGYAIGAGTIIFPLLYILSDVLTEVYGFSASRQTIWIAFCSSCFFSIFIYLVSLFPASEYWEQQEAFEQIFLVSPRIVAGSLLSYFAGELLNTTIIAFLKVKFQGKYFALRAIFSTLMGALLESTLFGYIAFFGRIPTSELIGMIVLLTIIKVVYEILVMPFTIKFVNYLKEVEGFSVFEKPSLKRLLPNFLKRF